MERVLLLDQNQLLLAGLPVKVLVQVEAQNPGFILLDTCGEFGEELSDLRSRLSQ